MLCTCGHEERWHDNEDAHCDKCECQDFEEAVDEEEERFKQFLKKYEEAISEEENAEI